MAAKQSEPQEEKTELTLAELIAELRENEKNLDSPINITLSHMTEMQLPRLGWNHYEVAPKKVKLTNSGHTAILSAKWFEERPYLQGGPFLNSYVFSQLHFHWGANDMEGSEHTVDGIQYPIEMHVVHFNSSYLNQDAALYEKDGVAVLVYFFKLQSEANPNVQILLDYFQTIQKALTSIKIEAKPINFIIPQFINDYFFYWGHIKTAARSHLILWIICREPLGLSAEQADIFRTLLDENEEPLLRNFRNIEPVPISLARKYKAKNIYHVNPSGSKYSTLLPLVPGVLPKYYVRRDSRKVENTQ